MCMRQSLISPNRIQSPLNYTGGKFRLLPQIQPLFPANIDVLVDLFCGGGNVGINTPAERIVLNDSDKNVMRIFRLFRQYPTEQILEIIDGIIDGTACRTVARTDMRFTNAKAREVWVHITRKDITGCVAS